MRLCDVLEGNENFGKLNMQGLRLIMYGPGGTFKERWDFE